MPHVADTSFGMPLEHQHQYATLPCLGIPSGCRSLGAKLGSANRACATKCAMGEMSEPKAFLPASLASINTVPPPQMDRVRHLTYGGGWSRAESGCIRAG